MPIRRNHLYLLVFCALVLTSGQVWAAGWAEASGMDLLIQVALVLPAFLLGIGFHEFAHAYLAVRLGDPTPEDEGRLSLNPLDHLEPMGSLLILGAYVMHLPLIGWGLPVPVRAAAFRNPIRDMMKVALAGPLMNLAIAGAGAALWMAGDSVRFGMGWGLAPKAAYNLQLVLQAIIVTNLSLALFNLLPIPPLDGTWVLREFLNSEQTLLLARIEPFGFLILLLLIQTPLLEAPFRFVFKLVPAICDSGLWLAAYLAAVGLAWHLLLRSLPDFSLRRSG
jgi:Zn-dependent protease